MFLSLSVFMKFTFILTLIIYNLSRFKSTRVSHIHLKASAKPFQLGRKTEWPQIAWNRDYTHTHTYTLEHCTLTLLRTSHRSALGVCFLAWERETHTALREMCLTEAQQRERQLSWVLFPSHSSISCCFLIERHTRCLLDDCCLSCGVSHYLAWRSVWRKTPICVCVCLCDCVFTMVPVSSTAVFSTLRSATCWLEIIPFLYSSQLIIVFLSLSLFLSANQCFCMWQ